MIRAVPHVAALDAYALADLGGSPETTTSLAQNESIRGPSPLAVSVAARALAEGHLYPDPDWTDLRVALADLHRIDPDDILCGTGSLDLIACIARAYADRENAVLAPAHAYPFFRTAARMAGARFDTADEIALTVSVDTLLVAVRPDTRIVFVANPGNPTGTRIGRADIIRLRAGLPADILLVIDEAYGEFADHLDEPLFDMVESGNTVVLRTFSKAYGLAGMRVGWGGFPKPIAAEVRKLLNPNNIAVASQAAVCAALRDQAYMKETCAMTADLRSDLMAGLQGARISAIESHTNFVLIPFRTLVDAQAADAALRAEGLVARGQSGAGLGHTLRITLASGDANDRIVRTLSSWAKGKVS